MNQKKTKTDLIFPKLRYRSRCPRESISKWIVLYCTVFIAIELFLVSTRDNFIAFGCKKQLIKLCSMILSTITKSFMFYSFFLKFFRLLIDIGQ